MSDAAALEEQNGTSSTVEKIELIWPDKGSDLVPRQNKDGSWTLEPRPEYRELRGFADWREHRSKVAGAKGLVIEGDRLASLELLSRVARRSVRFAYLDLPRIKVDDQAAAFQGESDRPYATWLGLARSLFVGVRPLLSRDGFVAIHVGDDESALARLVGDEVFDRQNFIATIVWQKAYAPRNMKGMTEFTATHDFILVYARERSALKHVGLKLPPEGYSNPDSDPRGVWKAEHKGAATRRESTDFATYVPPYRWELVSGELPPGIWRINPATGVLWAPQLNAAGSFRATFRATDSDGTTADRDLEIVVADEGEAPALATLPWLFSEIETNGKLRITTSELPVGVVGEEYSAVVLAEGGAPFRDAPKRPGKPRYWEYANYTLAEAFARDAVDLGRGYAAIPRIKKYDPGDVGIRNQVTWWPGRNDKDLGGSGYTQDATKHLRALASAGLISRVATTSKPDALISRLLDIFSDAGDLVLEAMGDCGDVASVALKRSRDFMLLRGTDERSLELTQGCVVPRLEAVVDGRDKNLDDAEGGESRAAPYIPFDGGGEFAIARLSDWFARYHPEDDVYELNDAITDDYLRDALLTHAGFFPAEWGEPTRSMKGRRIAIALHPSDFLSTTALSQWVTELIADIDQLVIFYFRADDDLELAELPPNVVCRRVPYAL